MNLKNIFKVLPLLLLVMPLTYAAGPQTLQSQKALEHESMTLHKAEVLLMMNRGGELYSSYTIHNLNQEEVFLITLKEENNLKTYLIEQDGSIEFVEESKLKQQT